MSLHRFPRSAFVVTYAVALIGCGSNETKAPPPPPTPASPIQATARDAGPLSISDDSLAIVPLKGSSLHRSLVFLNDTSAPLKITEAKTTFQGQKGVQPVTRAIIYHQIQIQVQGSKPVHAARGRIVYFDTFNSQIQAQRIVWQQNLGPGESQTLTWNGTLDRDKFASLLTMVAYIDQARLADGSVWTPDPKEIARHLSTLHLEFEP